MSSPLHPNNAFHPGRLWSLLWTCTQTASLILCLAQLTAWLYEYIGDIEFESPLSYFNVSRSVNEFCHAAVSLTAPAVVHATSKALRHTMSICCGGCVNQIAIVVVQRRTRIVDVVVGVCWLMACLASWSLYRHHQVTVFALCFLVFWLSLAARRWKSKSSVPLRHVGRKHVASHLRKISPMPPTTSPQESDTSSFDSSSDDDDHLHPSAQAEEVKVSTIDDNLFNMSLDSAGNPVPTTRSQLNNSSWLSSAKGKGFFKPSSQGSSSTENSPHTVHRQSPTGRHSALSFSSKPLVSPARFTVASQPPLHPPPALSSSPVQFGAKPRFRRQHTMSSDDEDFPAVSFADQMLDRRKPVTTQHSMSRKTSATPQEIQSVADAPCTSLQANTLNPNVQLHHQGIEGKTCCHPVLAACLVASITLNILLTGFILRKDA